MSIQYVNGDGIRTHGLPTYLIFFDSVIPGLFSPFQYNGFHTVDNCK